MGLNVQHIVRVVQPTWTAMLVQRGRSVGVIMLAKDLVSVLGSVKEGFCHQSLPWQEMQKRVIFSCSFWSNRFGATEIGRCHKKGTECESNEA